MICRQPCIGFHLKTGSHSNPNAGTPPHLWHRAAPFPRALWWGVAAPLRRAHGWTAVLLAAIVTLGGALCCRTPACMHMCGWMTGARWPQHCWRTTWLCAATPNLR